MTQPNSNLHARFLIYVAVLATITLYWAGLRGPFVLDDLPNLSPLQGWQDGQASAMELIFGNRSGILGRPVSMATLWFSAATGGMHPFPFKFGNLLIHIACGVLGWQLLRRLLENDPQMAPKANLIAASLAALWLLHPINVSTVLYAVQRMAQLSTLFVLASVWTYVLARKQLAAGDNRPALIKLFLFFPLLLAAGLFSKENAAVAPALCLVVELAYFRQSPAPPRVLPAFYSVFLLLPALLVAALLLLSPGRLLGGYVIRDFTLVERLLSQSRALVEYLGLILWPRGGQMGVYVDDFVASTGLLAPPSTLIAILGLLAISAAAVALRKQAPSLFAGWFFFLIAHSVESSILPLELYFDHRNYLPSLGIILATAGLLSWAISKLPSHLARKATVSLSVLTTVAAAVLSSLTWQQVQVWRSEEALATHALQNRPNSLRAALAQTTVAVNSGRWDEARNLTGNLISSSNPRHRLLGNIHTLTIDCLRGAGGHPSNLSQAEHSGVKFATIVDAQAFTQLAKAMELGGCGPNINSEVVAESIIRLLDSTPSQPDTAQPKWQLRTTAADLYLRAGLWEKAQKQAELAWQPTVADTAIGGMLAHIYIATGNKAAAQRVLEQIRDRVSAHEKIATNEIMLIQTQIDAMPE